MSRRRTLLLALAACLAQAAPARAADVVVKPSDSASAGAVQAAASAAGLSDPRSLPGGYVAYEAADAARAATAIGRSGVTDFARPALRARAAGLPGDDTGSAVRGSGVAGGWREQQWDFLGPYGIDVTGAWERAAAAGRPGGRGVVVALLDSGVAYRDSGRYRRSPDLPVSRIRRGYDFVGHDRYPNDAYGHGTFVASVVAAAANNGYGMVGVAYNASILPVRVLDSRGEGSSARVAQGIRYAVDHGADVVNMSIELYGGDVYSPHAESITVAPEIRAALDYARRHRVPVIAASGNSGEPSVPSRRMDSSIIYVGATTEHGCLAEYSNFGPGVDILAPGGGPDAVLPDDRRCTGAPAGRNIRQVSFQRANPGLLRIPVDFDRRSGLQGTSMAAPHVAGAIALLLASGELGSKPTTLAIQQRLAATAVDLGAPGPDRYYGAGLLDTTAALRGSRTPVAR